MHRARLADALLPQIATEQAASIIIISEQYSRRTDGKWFDDCSGTAAIWIPHSSNIRPSNSGRGNGFVWIKLEDCFIISCYLTPSDNMEDFQSKLSAIEDEMRNIGGSFIVAGDFNSSAVEWGSRRTNTRGRRILEMGARMGLTVANVGSTPTFQRPGCEGTIPDITLVSDTLVTKINGWKVLDMYTGSDHQYISYSFRKSKEIVKHKQNGTRRWNVNKLNKTTLISAIDQNEHRMNSDATSVVKRTMEIINKACNMAMPKISTMRRGKQAVYWWNDSIAELRKNCFRLRRLYTRARRLSTAEREREAYKEAQKILRNAIKKSKKDKWEELRSDINRNQWGLGYKIVMKKLGSKSPVEEMDEEIMNNIVNTLFPTHNRRRVESNGIEISTFSLFTEDELKEAAAKLKPRKAPGPDGIPAEVLKEIVEARPKLLLDMYNKCILEGLFPETWKEQKLVLISKGKGEPSAPSSYRPLCMLNTAGKLLERLLKPRIQEAIRAKGGLSERQHGFRPGKSTLGAIKDVVDTVLAGREKNNHSRPIVLLATLDVKNAFNSLRWSDVLYALEKDFGLPNYLMKILRSYLRDRTLIYDTKQGTRRIDVTSGAAQGSILGPDLWNASYDGILRMDMPEDTFLVGYADDIAAVIQARTTEQAQRRLNQVMIRTSSWLESHGLQLAAHKTELLLLTGRRIPAEINMSFGDVEITTRKTINYLGIRLDTKLTFFSQIKYATEKSCNITSKLSRLMANIGGPIGKRRKLLMEACNSILLYGCEIWGDTLKTKQRAQKLISVQRTAALRVAASYRTVSASAVQVIAGMVPVDLQVEERKAIFIARQTTRPGEINYDAIKSNTIRKWQHRWITDSKGRWTAKLIPNIELWIRRKHGDVNFYTTQMLSGHGYFRKYLYVNNKCSTPYCIYERNNCIDDAEHTFFQCIRWRNEREGLNLRIGPITPQNIIEKMTEQEKVWNLVENFCEKVLRIKKVDLDITQRAGLDASNN